METSEGCVAQVHSVKRVSSNAASEDSVCIQAHSGHLSSTPTSPRPRTLHVNTTVSQTPSSPPRGRGTGSARSRSVRSSAPVSPGSSVSSRSGVGSPPPIANPYQNVPPSQRYFRHALREAQGSGPVPRSLQQRYTELSRSWWNTVAKVRAMVFPGRGDNLMGVSAADDQPSGLCHTRTATSLITEYALCALDVGRIVVAPKSKPLPVRYLSAHYE